jgi:GT2 family glycosyltransferase
LRALAGVSSLPFEVIVVANGTSDKTLSDLPDPESLVLVRSPVNLGYGGGCNWGARVARGRHIVVLNDDTVAEPGWLEALVTVAEGDGRIGAVGSRLLNPDGSLQEAGSVLWNDAGTYQVGHGLPPGSSAYARVREVDYCSGCGLLVKRTAWDAVGGFDEGFFPAYFEDVDLCLTLRAHGYRVVYAPRARLIHLGGASTAANNRAVAGVRNGRRFSAKWREELRDYDPPPTARRRDQAVAAAIRRAERRTPSLQPRVPQPLPRLEAPSELEVRLVYAHALEAALAVDDQLVLEFVASQQRTERLRRAAGRFPLGRQLGRWISRRLG